MAGKLIKHLEMKAQEHPHLELLKSQWCFDQELIPKALQNVGTIFPHFSRHDASHSRQILINIERLLGDNLAKLTATDTWLLLESAYWHDIGMVVTASDIDKDITSNDFKQFVREIADSKAHELREFAKSFLDDKNPSCFSLSNHPYESVEKFRLLLADWYRKHHPKRAEKTVNNPWEIARIASPRTELLPKRLFRLLGQICSLHGSGFNQILSDLPFREAGMATEDCHPRFIACLLRLGDLFDLDDNRFCPVMLRMAGNIPDSSQAHIHKHAAIRHFRLDPECVEISAECEGDYAYEAYVAADQWFGWIKDELRDQMNRWKDIVPSREFGLLPTLGKMEVNLAPPYRLINPSERPRFEIDWEKGIELLQGANLYDRPEQAIRELLQNAVDSTLIRIWLEHGNGRNKNISWDSPYSKEVVDLFKHYPIRVELRLLGDSDDKDKELWELSITDKGIGISISDLEYMRHIGGSSRNQRKKKIVDEMPEWMKPSGIFGIGLQSVFQLTEEVKLTTRSHFEKECIEIKLTDTASSFQGKIFIKESDDFDAFSSGAKLAINIKLDKIPKSIRMYNKEYIAMKYMRSFDPIKHDRSPYKAGCIIDEVAKFSPLSLVPVNVFFQNEKALLENRIDEKLYCPATGISLIKFKFIAEDHGQINVSFRGQSIKDYQPTFPFCFGGFDILKSQASHYLSIDRNNIRKEQNQNINDDIVNTIKYFIENTKIKVESQEEKAAASLFFKLNEIKLRGNMFSEEWRDFPLTTCGLTIKEIFGKEAFSLLRHYRFSREEEIKEEVGKDNYVVPNYSGYSTIYIVIEESHGKFFTQLRVNDNYMIHVFFSKTEVKPYADDYLIKSLLQIPDFSSRKVSTVWDIYLPLAANLEGLYWYDILEGDYYLTARENKRFVLPFFYDIDQRSITTENFDDLVNWTFEHRLDKKVTKEQIRETYEKFIDWVDNDLMKNSGRWDKWKALRGLKD